MLNEDKLKLMTSIAMFEKREGKAIFPANRYFTAVQYHPEFKSRPNKAHPLFREFIRAALEREPHRQ